MAKGIRRGASAGGTGGVAGKTFVQYWVDQGKTYTAWVDYGDSVLSPSSFTPTKTGYTFLGWKETNVADGDVLVTKVAETRFLTLYAVFTRTVTVTYYDNSTTATTSMKTIYYNNTNEAYPSYTLTQATKPTWTGRGWTEFNSDGASVITYQNGETFTREDDITLYGCYERTVTLSYNNNGGTGEMASETGTAYYHTISGETDATFILDENTFTKTDYQFVQWRLNSASGTAYQPLDTYESCTDDTMYAEWMVLSTLVRYNVDIGEYYEEWVPRGDSVLSPSSFTPTKTGYTFLGWKDSGIASSDVLVTKTASGDNMTLYAVFTKAVTITLYNASNTPTYDYSTSYYNNMDILNSSYTLTEATLTNWTKLGWTDEDNSHVAKVSDGYTFEAIDDVTFYSLYSQTITLTYYNSNNTAITDTGTRYANVHETTTYDNPEFILPAQTELSGWTTRGWTTGSTGDATITHTSGVEFELAVNTEISGCYEKTVTVSYNANGGSGTAMADSTGTAYYHSKNGNKNASIVLKSNTYAKTSYVFSNWRLNSASGTAYNAGATLSTSSNATMYAYWVSATKTFNYTGGMQSFSAQAGVTYKIQVYGARGGSYGSASGGYGGYAIGYRKPSSNETWYIGVGGQGGSGSSSSAAAAGYNGGATGGGWADPPSGTHGTGCGGGGASHVGLSNALLKNTAVANLIICAGGGGGGGGGNGWWPPDYDYATHYSNGGAGGGTSGSSGAGTDGYGSGGTQSAGGTAYGAYGQGGVINSSGGGGGYYGGGGGNWSGAGGGSGNCRGCTSSSMSNGQRNGNGAVIISVYSTS